MRNTAAVFFLLALILSGCSSVTVIPRPTMAGAVVNPSDQSIKINQSNLTVSARVQDTAVGGYSIETALASFYLTILNRSESPLTLSLDNFKLSDGSGNVHIPVTPEEVNAILNPEISYFLPYPFVGYYNIVELEQYRSTSAMASERAYIGAGLSAVELLTPLPTGEIKPGQLVSGMLYFEIELLDQNFVELKAIFSVGKNNRDLSYSFPFSIEK